MTDENLTAILESLHVAINEAVALLPKSKDEAADHIMRAMGDANLKLRKLRE